MKVKALTLIELLVVMAIIAAMAILSIYTMISFRRTIQLNQVTSEVLSFFKESENLAKNNTLPKELSERIQSDPTNLDFAYCHAIFFDDNNDDMVRAIGRRENKAGVGPAWYLVPGLEYQANVKSSIFQDIELNSENCAGIIFVNLTGDIKIQRSVFGADFVDENFPPCRLHIKHKSEAKDYKVIEIDGINDTFKIVNLE